MAKDGTNRGGARLGSGRKSKNLKILTIDGQTVEDPEKKAPKIKQYLNAKQENGKPLGAKRIYKDMFAYLQNVGCVELVPEGLIEQYAVATARWIQCEMAVSEYGLTGEHPTTKGTVASVYIGASLNYMKQANQAFFQINQIVKDNRVIEIKPNEAPENDLLKRLKAAKAN